MPYDRLKPPAPSFRIENGRPRIDFDHYLPFSLTAIANRIARSASRTYLRRFGVGINEWRIISNLRAWPGITANMICQRSGLDKAAVSRSLKLLEDAGMVRGCEDGSDTRGRGMKLTQKGDDLHDRLISVALEREGRLLTGFSETERAMLLGFVARLHENVRLVQEEDSPPLPAGERKGPKP
jgi:DNA-binding MarR family transcriptional regulator